MVSRRVPAGPTGRPHPAGWLGGRPVVAHRTARRCWAVAAGLVADAALGEPPLTPHPVAAFGTAMRAWEGHRYADTRRAGVAHASAGLLLGAAAGRSVRSTAVATWVTVAGRSLHEAAGAVAEALEGGDHDRARALLPALVGRDPSGLDAKEMARAVVESVAENTVDAVVAPTCWALLGGAVGAGAHRAVNTLDAMVGHRGARYERYGWASARLDDAMAWVPARITAATVAAVRPHAAGTVWRCVRDQAPGHPSPNAGVAEAAFAAALGLRLGGENRYGDRVELRPALGEGRLPEPADIAAAVRLSADVTRVLVVALTGAGVLMLRGQRRGARR